MLENGPIIIKINHSKQLLALLISVHALTVFSLLLLSVNFSFALFFIVPVGFSLYYYVGDSRKVSCVIATESNEWQLKFKDGSQLNCNLSGKTCVSDWLSLLVFSNEEQSVSRCVVLMRDSTSMEMLSRLKLLLKVRSESI